MRQSIMEYMVTPILRLSRRFAADPWQVARPGLGILLLAALVQGFYFGRAMNGPTAIHGVVASALDERVQRPATMSWGGLTLAPPSECGPVTGPREAERSPGPRPKLAQITQLLASFGVLATGYSSSPEETDDSPTITADNRTVQYGLVALSRDLLREFTPGAPFGFGDDVEIRGVGRFIVADTMSPRLHGRVDIWFPTREEAIAWGVRRVQLSRS